MRLSNRLTRFFHSERARQTAELDYLNAATSHADLEGRHRELDGGAYRPRPR